jgi:DNA-directed RNA polymerase subunit RPC12/RpoP
MIDLPDDLNAESASSEYAWTECSACGVALRKPIYDTDPVMCSYCSDLREAPADHDA